MKKAEFKDKWLNTFGKELLQEYKDFNYLCLGGIFIID